MKDCLKNTFRPESGGPDPIPGGWEDTLVKGTVSFDELESQSFLIRVNHCSRLWTSWFARTVTGWCWWSGSTIKQRSIRHTLCGISQKIGIIILRALTARPHKWQNVNRGLREAPFWNALVLYGHCPNSFRPPPPLSNRQTWQKVPQTILASPYNPGHLGKKCPNHPGRPLHLPHPPYGQCPYANNTLQKGVSLT